MPSKEVAFRLTLNQSRTLQHVLRRCGAWLVLASVSLNVVQKVMRHSTITLTIDTYGHMLPGAEADAVDNLAEFFALPEIEAAQALKSGTDDAPVEGAQ
jgi:hypothetical protein